MIAAIVVIYGSVGIHVARAGTPSADCAAAWDPVQCEVIAARQDEQSKYIGWLIGATWVLIIAPAFWRTFSRSHG